MTQQPMLRNSCGERIDTLVEGNESSDSTIIFVHGLGTDKHETGGYFDDIAAKLCKSHRVIRFDFTGYGQSEGKSEDVDYFKQTDDLKTIIEFAQHSFSGRLNILAQSMGCFVTSLLCPDGIHKTIFTGIPNANTQYLIDRLVKRMESRPGAIINLDGISIFPRSSGALQHIGANFWKVIRDLDPAKAVTAYAANTNLLIIHPKQDDVVGTKYLKPYSTIPNVMIDHLDGNHSFTDLDQRRQLIQKISEYFG